MKEYERYVDFGGDGPVLLFAHANAYTPLCYQKFLIPFTESYHVIAPKHRPLWKNQGASQLKSWHLFRDDLIRFMSREGLSGVPLIGHSLGAVAGWMASGENKDLFSRLLLVDPVVLMKPGLNLSRFIPFILKKKYFPIVKIASRRRDSWDNHVDALAYFQSKKVFQRFDQEVLNDFIQYGLNKRNDHVTLSFPREWEARIYASPPNLWPVMRKTSVPTVIFKAEFSDVITPTTWTRMQENCRQCTFEVLKGLGHLAPFERPEQMTHIIQKALDEPLTNN